MINKEPVWRPIKCVSRTSVPPTLWFWLSDSASLTKRLKSLCGTGFDVRVVNQGWGKLHSGERKLLGMAAKEQALVRQVKLLCHCEAWVFARTIIPRRTLRGRGKRLAQLGNKPLGEMLFKDPRMRRDEVQIACIRSDNPVFGGVIADEEDTTRLWGRRSVFWVDDQPLLVSEFFLPPIAERGN